MSDTTNNPESTSSLNDFNDQFVVEQLIEDLISMVERTRGSFRSSSVSINRERILGLLNEAKEKFPEEVSSAKWLIDERKAFIDKVQQEKDEIISEAQKRSAELVNRVEVVREAQKEAERIIQAAIDEAARRKYQVDIYCIKQLEKFEGILAKVYDEVQLGRAKLQTEISETPDTTQRSLDFSSDERDLNKNNSGSVSTSENLDLDNENGQLANSSESGNVVSLDSASNSSQNSQSNIPQATSNNSNSSQIPKSSNPVDPLLN